MSKESEFNTDTLDIRYEARITRQESGHAVASQKGETAFLLEIQNGTDYGCVEFEAPDDLLSKPPLLICAWVTWAAIFASTDREKNPKQARAYSIFCGMYSMALTLAAGPQFVVFESQHGEPREIPWPQTVGNQGLVHLEGDRDVDDPSRRIGFHPGGAPGKTIARYFRRRFRVSSAALSFLFA